MFTIRNIGGVSLLLFGTRFLWITPEFVTAGLKNTGWLWSTTRVLALVTLLGLRRPCRLAFRDSLWDGVDLGCPFD